MATSSIPHLLILEPDSRGHIHEWIGHLVALIREDMGTSAQLRATATSDDPATQTAAEPFNTRLRDWAYLLDESVTKHVMARPEDLTGKR